jgi:RNA polymerase primary sigma factor
MVVNLKTQSDIFQRTETLTRYFEDIRKYKGLSLEEETELFYNFHNALNQKEKEKIKKQIVNANYRFVVAIAKKFATNDNLLDLISEGNIGLLEAVDKFDPSKGVKFSTFAVWYIRRAINLYNINFGNTVTKSNISKTYHVISQATNKFVQKENRQPTLDELKDILVDEYNISIKDADDVMDTKFISIDESDYKDEDDINNSYMKDYNVNSASTNLCEKGVENEFNGTLVKCMLNELTTKEQEIIKFSFGIGCDREYELQEIAEKMNITSERVRQIKRDALQKLKSVYKIALNVI